MTKISLSLFGKINQQRILAFNAMLMNQIEGLRILIKSLETPKQSMYHERLWQVYSTINEWVRFADAKSGIALAAHATIFTVAIPPIIQYRAYFRENSPFIVAFTVSTLAALASIFFGIRCVIPRLNVGEARSLIFFAHIAQRYNDSDSFAAHSIEHYNNDDSYARQIQDQIWANAKVAWQKHKDSVYCLRFMIIEAFVAVITFIYAFFFT
jgi:hypothetical protein